MTDAGGIWPEIFRAIVASTIILASSNYHMGYHGNR